MYTIGAWSAPLLVSCNKIRFSCFEAQSAYAWKVYSQCINPNNVVYFYVLHSCPNFYPLSCRIQVINMNLQAEWGKNVDPGPKVIKLFSCSFQLSMKFILLINVSLINITSERLKARIFFNCFDFSFYEQLKIHSHLSRA